MLEVDQARTAGAQSGRSVPSAVVVLTAYRPAAR